MEIELIQRRIGRIPTKKNNLLNSNFSGSSVKKKKKDKILAAIRNTRSGIATVRDNICVEVLGHGGNEHVTTLLSEFIHDTFQILTESSIFITLPNKPRATASKFISPLSDITWARFYKRLLHQSKILRSNL